MSYLRICGNILFVEKFCVLFFVLIVLTLFIQNIKLVIGLSLVSFLHMFKDATSIYCD